MEHSRNHRNFLINQMQHIVSCTQVADPNRVKQQINILWKDAAHPDVNTFVPYDALSVIRVIQELQGLTMRIDLPKLWIIQIFAHSWHLLKN